MAFYFLGGLRITENKFASPGIETHIYCFAGVGRADTILIIVNRNLSDRRYFVLPSELTQKLIYAR